MPAQVSTVKIRDVAIKLHRVGQGPPVLFLHGANGLPQWLPFFDAVADGYEVLVPEHPGFGGSDDPAWIRNVPDLAMFYLDFIEEMKLDRFHLIGHSLGGWLAAEIAIRDRSRLRSLTIMSAAGIRVKGLPSGDLFIWGPEETVRNIYHDQALADRILSLKPTEEQMDILLKNRFTSAKFGWQPRWFNPDLEKWLHRLKLPSLVVWGRQDKVFPWQYADLWVERLPQARLVMVDDCGHAPHVEKADWVIPEIRAFLKEAFAMKLLAFHLMPYRPLDFEAAAKSRSAWVVLPNSLYDPVKGAEEYERHIDLLAYGETLGFDGIGVNEHHQTAYGMMPAPNLIAAALIQRTKRAKIAIIGRALPLQNNPVFVAEEYAMLDNMSKGRIIAGFVRGIGAEYHSSGTNPYFSHERFHEAHDLIVRAWTEPGPWSFDSENFNLRYVNLWPRPYQQPHPPIWIPSQGSSETVQWASHPDRRYPFLVTFSPGELVTRYLNSYRDQARKYGYESTGDQLGWAAPIYIADTDERAREEAKAGLETLFNNYLRMSAEMLIPPGYTSQQSTKNFFRMRQSFATRDSFMSVDQLIANGVALVGTAKTVRAGIERMREATGMNILIGLFQFGTLSDELARRSMERFATEVMPHLRA